MLITEFGAMDIYMKIQLPLMVWFDSLRMPSS